MRVYTDIDIFTIARQPNNLSDKRFQMSVGPCHTQSTSWDASHCIDGGKAAKNYCILSTPMILSLLVLFAFFSLVDSPAIEHVLVGTYTNGNMQRLSISRAGNISTD